MNLGSKELFINMKEKDIPYWNDLYPFDEQDDDVKQFWDNEAIKLSKGLTINGVFIHPWLYWHLNFWHMMLDIGTNRVPGLSQLRDNEWFFAEILKQAEEENKGIFLFGTRRFGKALLNSEILYLEDREKKIGDILVGDYIYDDSGSLVEVSGVYPQGNVLTYRIVFEDGRNVICCGEHMWKVKIGNKWIERNLKGIMLSDYKKMSIPISKPIDYPRVHTPIQPSAYGAMLSSFLSGSLKEIPFDKTICRKFLRSSIEQKNTFIESFIRASNNIITGEDIIDINNKDLEVIVFVQKMFWSFGWYANYDGKSLILSNNKKELAIKEISIYGKYPATCITVNNRSRLFLTTNYIVTHNTAIMSSFLARNATMTYNLTHNVIGGSKEDLMNLGEYLEFGFDNIHPFLKINRTGNDWFKEVILGTKNVRNERDIHARIRITNIDQGRPSAALKPAGGTPFTTIYDEVGKYPFLAPYEAGLPSHMQNGRMRGMIIACGTGGNVEKSQDAQKVMNDPVKYGFIIFNYDILNRRCLKPTWRICKSGCFAPGQMSHAFEKEKTTLDKFLNLDNSPGLKKIKINVTNFDKNTDDINNKLDSLANGDKSSYVQYKMAYPKTIDDCFLNANVNRFPVEDALIHKSRLLEEGRPGKLVDIFQIEGRKIGYKFSEKVLAPFPFKGGNIDAPVIIYEDPPEEGGCFNYLYSSGLDPYKQDKSGTDSLGAFYIFKRHVKINDPFSNSIVASVVSRPPIADDFCRTCEMLIEAYGAKCLMENADRMFETYLTRRNKQFVLLEEGEKLASKFVKAGARQNNKFGLAPTVPNQRMLFNIVLQYCWEDVVFGFDDDGNTITKKGIYRIPDIELLDEIIAFGPGVNTDRIIAFGHALALSTYYDDMNFMPESSTQKSNEQKREKRRVYQVKGFVTQRHNPFKLRS